MKLGLITPTYTKEKRVALLPWDISSFSNKIYIESGFGFTLDIPDEAYIEKGCIVASKEEVFNNADAIFSLKGIDPEDYHLLQNNQIVIGFIQPTRQGKQFFDTIGLEKSLYVVDLDNVNASIYHKDQAHRIPWIPRNFVYKNSVLAGYAAVMHATMMHGMIPSINTKVAILGSGNVSQGAFEALSKLGASIRMFYRKSMDEFKNELDIYDIIVNGIEISESDAPILTLEEQHKLKPNMLFIDVAAVPNQAIQGTRQTKLDEPLYKENGVYYYVVNNTPSLFYKEASQILSEAFGKHVFKRPLETLLELRNKK